MNNKLEPVHCGCGGEPEIFHIAPEGYAGSYCVRCTECLTQTPFFNKDKDKAIEVWNRAMGERTAKVENQYRDYLPYARFMIEELRGNCEKCGEIVWKGEKYCHECGARLEWE